jgi:hypothetical protein
MPFIMKSRGLSRAIGMSQLLDTSPEIKVGRGPGRCAGAARFEAACRALPLPAPPRLWPQPSRLPSPSLPAGHHRPRRAGARQHGAGCADGGGAKPRGGWEGEVAANVLLVNWYAVVPGAAASLHIPPHRLYAARQRGSNTPPFLPPTIPTPHPSPLPRRPTTARAW